MRAQLDSCRLAFNRAPSLRTLRELATLWARAERWQLSAQAWLHVASACPQDAHALACAATALSRLDQHAHSAELWERACRMQPDNREYADARARASRGNAHADTQEELDLIRTDL